MIFPYGGRTIGLYVTVPPPYERIIPHTSKRSRTSTSTFHINAINKHHSALVSSLEERIFLTVSNLGLLFDLPSLMFLTDENWLHSFITKSVPSISGKDHGDTICWKRWHLYWYGCIWENGGYQPNRVSFYIFIITRASIHLWLEMATWRFHSSQTSVSAEPNNATFKVSNVCAESSSFSSLHEVWSKHKVQIRRRRR